MWVGPSPGMLSEGRQAGRSPLAPPGQVILLFSLQGCFSRGAGVISRRASEVALKDKKERTYHSGGLLPSLSAGVVTSLGP